MFNVAKRRQFLDLLRVRHRRKQTVKIPRTQKQICKCFCKVSCGRSVIRASVTTEPWSRRLNPSQLAPFSPAFLIVILEVKCVPQFMRDHVACDIREGERRYVGPAEDAGVLVGHAFRRVDHDEAAAARAVSR